MATTKIQIGIYGNTQAGKTHFLYRFLLMLKESLGNTAFVAACRKGTASTFLDQLETSLKEDERISPTSTYSETENIIVRFSNTIDHHHSRVKFCRNEPDYTTYRMTFRDLVGERTRDALDDLSTRSSVRNNIMMRQIKRCDVFLFFLDPTYGISLDDNQTPVDGAKLNDEYLRQEKQRAELLIDTVIRIRENRNLPIIFVQTHRDVLESLSAQEQRKARNWFADVNKILHEKYKPLGSVPCPSLTDPNKTEFQISSIQKDLGNSNIVPMLGSMLDLYRDYVQTTSQDFWKVLSTVFLLVLLAVGIVGGIYSYRILNHSETISSKPVSSSPRLDNSLVEELNEIPAGWPENRNLRGSMKRALIQITQSQSVPGSAIPAADLHAFESALKRIQQEILDDSIPPEHRLEIAELLTGLYTTDIRKASTVPFDMDKIAKKTEELLRLELTNELRELLERHGKLSTSVSMDLYRELIAALTNTQDRISRLNLSFTKSNFALSSDIKNAVLLLQGRVRQKSYVVRVFIECFASPNVTISINFKNQQDKKPVYLREQRTDDPKPDGSCAYVLQTNPNTFTLPLDTKIPELQISQYNMNKETWTDLRHTASLVSDRVACLAALGMPLVFKEEVAFRVDLADVDNDPITLQLRFEPVYDSLPTLLWNAIAPKAESKNSHESKTNTNL